MVNYSEAELIEALSRHPMMRMYDYYLELAGTSIGVEKVKSLPSRGGFNPLKIPKLVPWMASFDVEHNGSGLRYRFRLVGDGVRDMLPEHAAGKFMDDICTLSTAALLSASFACSLSCKTAKLDVLQRTGADQDTQIIILTMPFSTSADGQQLVSIFYPSVNLFNQV